ncbi:hypothetical protein TNCV_816131 [Trichonephila clavipes]|nr:hypothetical protein TNCV_816131 [Trichonephila clavipes]
MDDLTRKGGRTQQCWALMKLRVQWTVSTLLDGVFVVGGFSLFSLLGSALEKRKGLASREDRDDFSIIKNSAAWKSTFRCNSKGESEREEPGVAFAKVNFYRPFSRRNVFTETCSDGGVLIT